MRCRRDRGFERVLVAHCHDSVGEDVRLHAEVVDCGVAGVVDTGSSGWTVRYLPHAELDGDCMRDVDGTVGVIDLILDTGQQTMKRCSHLLLAHVIG